MNKWKSPAHTLSTPTLLCPIVRQNQHQNSRVQYEVVFYNNLIFLASVYSCPSSPTVPLQLLHVGAVFRKNPDPPAIRGSPVQVKSQVVRLVRLAAGEDGYLAGSRDRSQVVDPQEVSRLMGQTGQLKHTKKKNCFQLLHPANTVYPQSITMF